MLIFFFYSLWTIIATATLQETLAEHMSGRKASKHKLPDWDKNQWLWSVLYCTGMLAHSLVNAQTSEQIKKCSHVKTHTTAPTHTHTRIERLCDMKGSSALRRDHGWRAWIKITINRIKKNKYLAIIEAEWFILHFHSAGWTAALKKSICNYRHPTLGRSSPSIHLPPPALHQHHHPQNKCKNSTAPVQENKK